MQNYCIVQFLGGLKSFERTFKEISLTMKLLFILLICSVGLAYASDGYAQKDFYYFASKRLRNRRSAAQD